MDTLDDDSAYEIYRRLAASGFRNLAPMLLIGKKQSSLAFSPSVLQHLSLHEFFNNPDLVNPGSPFRSFFKKCVFADNPIAVYLEGVRIACKEADLHSAISLLEGVVQRCEYAGFASGMFLIYASSPNEGMTTIASIFNRVGSLGRLNEIANVVYRHLRSFQPVQRRLFSNIHVVETIPACLGHGCTTENRCFNCSVFWYIIRFNDFM